MATHCDEEMPETKVPPSQLFPARQKGLHAKRRRHSDDQDTTDLEPAIKRSLRSSVAAPTVTCIKQGPVTEYERRPVIQPVRDVERELHKKLETDAVCPDNGAGTHIESQPTTELETDAVIDAKPITEQSSSACGSAGHLAAMEDSDTSKGANLLSRISSSMMTHLPTLLEGEHTKFELINELFSDMLNLYHYFSSHYGSGSSDSQSQAEHSDDDSESLELERRPVVRLEPFRERLICVNRRLFTLADAVISSCSQVQKELETLAICPEPDTDSVRGGGQPTTGLETDPVINAEPITEQSTLACGSTGHLSTKEDSERLEASISRLSSPVKSLFVKLLKKQREIGSKLTEMLNMNAEFMSHMNEYYWSNPEASDDSDADDESLDVDSGAGSSLSDTEED